MSLSLIVLSKKETFSLSPHTSASILSNLSKVLLAKYTSPENKTITIVERAVQIAESNFSLSFNARPRAQ